MEGTTIVKLKKHFDNLTDQQYEDKIWASSDIIFYACHTVQKVCDSVALSPSAFGSITGKHNEETFKFSSYSLTIISVVYVFLNEKNKYYSLLLIHCIIVVKTNLIYFNCIIYSNMQF